MWLALSYGLGWYPEEKGKASWTAEFTSLSPSWPLMQCDQLPHPWTTIPSVPCWAVSHLKLLGRTNTASLTLLLVKYLVTANEKIDVYLRGLRKENLRQINEMVFEQVPGTVQGQGSTGWSAPCISQSHARVWGTGGRLWQSRSGGRLDLVHCSCWIMFAWMHERKEDTIISHGNSSNQLLFLLPFQGRDPGQTLLQLEGGK